MVLRIPCSGEFLRFDMQKLLRVLQCSYEVTVVGQLERRASLYLDLSCVVTYVAKFFAF
jgi:hypothetical protein